MKKLPSEAIQRNNRRALGLCLAAAALIAVLFSLPVYQFDTALLTKKSGNTFVGDERYVAARAEVDEAAARHQSEGRLGEVTVSQEVTERVNSKGETTSMVTFRVNVSAVRNGWSFMASGLPSGKTLLACALAAGLALLLTLLTLAAARDAAPAELSRPHRGMRQTACWLTLLAVLLVILFHFHTVQTFQRQLLLPGASPSRQAALLNAADAFLYGGHGGDTTASLVSQISYHSTWTLWMLLPALFLMLTQMILLSQGALKRALTRGLLYLFVIVLCVVILYPYYVMLITAFRNNAETTDMYFTNLLPTKWVWSNLTDIVNRGVPRYLLNSLLLSTGATLIALGCGIPAAYAMARMSFRGKKPFLGFVIMSQMFAPIVLLVGISQLMNFLGLNDSVAGLMLINAAFNQAFAIWLLRGTFVSISPEMEQAACIDGCNTVSALLRVLLPMAAPGIVTTLIFVFINAWNEYTISTVLISTPVKKPITVGITQFSSFNMIEWQYLFASALLATIPVVIMFMFIERHLVAGLTAGGVKG